MFIDEGFTIKIINKKKKKNNDYHETFSLISKKDSFRIIMDFVDHFGMELHQIDVEMILLNGGLEEKVYMKRPKGFSDNDNNHLVCK